MIELRGKYNTAKVFTENIEKEAISQVIDLCNQEFSKNSKIRLMPDVHKGAGCTIGTTMTIVDKIVPNLVGVDIGCGVEVVKISEKEVDFEKLDATIRSYIPFGFNIRKNEHKYINKINLEELRCKNHVNIDRARLSLGSQGGGNHFFECNINEKNEIYLAVHSGSRNLGKQVAEYYQEKAFKNLNNSRVEKEQLVKELKLQGREKEIQTALSSISSTKVRKELAYLEGADFEDYIHDMRIVQKFAELNRKAIMDEVVSRMKLNILEQFTTIHNYIDMDNMILRKGAISAQEGEKVIIPINMADGSIIAIGKGNPDWNFSAPHGAGRILSRSKAKSAVSMDEFRESMKDIWTTSVCEGTIDESPMAYKPMKEIIENIKNTVDIVEIIRPLYNFKASE